MYRPSSFPSGRGHVKCNHYYLSSYFIVVQVKSRPRIVPVFQDVDKTPCLLLSKPDVISTSAPLPITVSAPLFLHGASTSGNFTLSALERDLVDDSRCTNSVDKRCLTSGCEKMARQRSVRLFFSMTNTVSNKNLCKSCTIKVPNLEPIPTMNQSLVERNSEGESNFPRFTRSSRH